MRTSLSLVCPNCRLDAMMTLKAHQKLMIYTCPGCKNNVIYYKGKVDIIPDHLFRKLLNHGKLVFCGDVQFKYRADEKPISDKCISKDDVTDLKILLETEIDSSRIISKL